MEYRFAIRLTAVNVEMLGQLQLDYLKLIAASKKLGSKIVEKIISFALFIKALTDKTFKQLKHNMNSSSRLMWLLSLAGAAAIGGIGTWLFKPKPGDVPSLQTPMISLEKMGHLVSVKVNYSDVLEFTEKRSLDIPWSQWEVRLGGTKVLLVAKGDCTVATNLSAAKYENVNPDKRTLTIVLPSPQPLQARVNHDSREKGGSYFYAITNQGLEPIIPDSNNRTQAINNALARAQKEINHVCSQPQILATAKQNTENILYATFQATDWTPRFIWK